MYSINGTEVDDFVRAYLECAIWAESNSDNSGEYFDHDHSIDEFSADSVNTAIRDCDTFRQQAGSLMNDIPAHSAGHDFWLTRNHHGAGFWDRGYAGGIGDKLTDIAHSFKECYPVLGGDGLLHLE